MDRAVFICPIPFFLLGYPLSHNTDHPPPQLVSHVHFHIKTTLSLNYSRPSNIISCQIGNTISRAEWFSSTLVSCRVPSVVTCTNCAVSITNDGQLYSQENVVFMVVGDSNYKGGTVVTKILPQSWSQESGGHPVSLIGQGFYNSTMVCCHFGVVQVHGMFVSTTEVRCIVPPFSPLNRVLPYSSESARLVNVTVSNNCMVPGESRVHLKYLPTCSSGWYRPRNTPIQIQCPPGSLCPHEGMIEPMLCPQGK